MNWIAETSQDAARPPVCIHLAGATTIRGGGGSNTFIRGLARRQAALGWKSVVVINQAGQIGSKENIVDGPSDDFGDEFSIRVLPAVRGTDRIAYYSRCPMAAPGVSELLEELQPSVVHFHTLNLMAGLPHLQAAKAVNAKTIVTYHTGGISCPQTGLLRDGKFPCDGRLELTRCTRCRFANRGMPALFADILARAPSALQRNPDGSLLSRLFSSRAMTEAFIASFRASIDLVDVFHIQSRWIERVLRMNGVTDEKLAFVEMGVSQNEIRPGGDTPTRYQRSRPLRLVFAGRCNDVKGIETILGALKKLPKDAPLSISLLGSGWESPYGRKLLAPFERDPRLLKPRAVDTEIILHELAKHDACLVPSVWLETGPLAVYEAMAAGLLIIGSRLGGIAERVRDNIDGLLFHPGSAHELANIITALLADPRKVQSLRRNIRPQRTFDDMARELDVLYRASPGEHQAFSGGVR